VGIYISRASLLVWLLVLFAVFVPFANANLPNSDIIDLGGGKRPVYQIGYDSSGSVDVDELIELAHKNCRQDPDLNLESDDCVPPAGVAVSPRPEFSQSPLSVTVAKNDSDIQPDDVLAEEEHVETLSAAPSYVQVPIVSSPPGAEVYIDGMFRGCTPLMVAVEPDPHLVEVLLDGHWDWFNIVSFSDGTRTIPVILTPIQGNESDKDSSLDGTDVNGSAIAANVTEAPLVFNDDFWNKNYHKILLMVAFLTFLIGSGSITTWARSYRKISIIITFPRDGEDRWGGLIEGSSNRVYGTSRTIYLLLRYDDDQLQVVRKVAPNRDGRWSTRCDVEEGTLYRIYAVVTDKSLPEGMHLAMFPTYRVISEVGPIVGRKKIAI